MNKVVQLGWDKSTLTSNVSVSNCENQRNSNIFPHLQEKQQFYLQEQSDTVMYNFIIDIL